MIRRFVCYGAIAAAVLAGTAATTAAQQSKPDEQKPEEKKTETPAPQVLLPARIAEKLQLSKEQQQKVEALEREFKSKREWGMMQTMLKMKSVLDTAEKDGDKAAAALAVTNAITGTLLDMRRTRTSYEKKLLGLLNDEQKKTFQEMKKEGRRQERRERRRERPDETSAEVKELPMLAYLARNGFANLGASFRND
jgi:Spy/CpxP family protein refolding chaperone